MKKLVIILVLVSYGFSSFGVSMHLQYCCGKLESFNFSLPKRMHCTSSKSHLSKPCCENKDVLLKIVSFVWRQFWSLSSNIISSRIKQDYEISFFAARCTIVYNSIFCPKN